MNTDKNKLSLLGDLFKIKNKKVTVLLNNGLSVYGKLKSVDDAYNLVIEKCSDWQFGNTVFILGRNLLCVNIGECTMF